MDKIPKEINEYEVNKRNLREIWISSHIKIIHLDKNYFAYILKLRPTIFLYLPSSYFKIINHNWVIVF